jgi:hypothetical protein
MDTITRIRAEVQALATAYLVMSEQSPRTHSTERMACRRLIAESELPTFSAHARSDRSMLVTMLRELAPRLEAEERERRRGSFDQVEFERIFG